MCGGGEGESVGVGKIGGENYVFEGVGVEMSLAVGENRVEKNKCGGGGVEFLCGCECGKIWRRGECVWLWNGEGENDGVIVEGECGCGCG